MKRLFAFALALATTGVVLSPAIANAQDEQRSASVTYDDLDLSTDEGVEELNSRIERAARYICALDETTLGSRIRSREARECVAQTRASIEEQLAEVVG